MLLKSSCIMPLIEISCWKQHCGHILSEYFLRPAGVRGKPELSYLDLTYTCTWRTVAWSHCTFCRQKLELSWQVEPKSIMYGGAKSCVHNLLPLRWKHMYMYTQRKYACQTHTLEDLFIDLQKQSLQTMPRFISDKGFSSDIAVQLGTKIWLFSFKQEE